MQITLEFSSSNRSDVKMLERLGAFISSAQQVYGEEYTEIDHAAQVIAEKNESVKIEAPEEPVAEEAIEAPAEEAKPKRTRKPRAKKEEAPAEPVEVAATEEEVAKAEETVEEAPVETPEVEEATEVKEEPVEVKEEPAAEPTTCVELLRVLAKTERCNAEQWRKMLQFKGEELGIIKPFNGGFIEGPNAKYKTGYMEFIHQLGETFGNRIPSKLDPESLYKFCCSYARMELNEEDHTFQLAPPF